MNRTILHILILGLLTTSFQIKNEKISRLNEPTISTEIYEVIPRVIDFKDTLHCDTLLEYLSVNQIPVMYSRKILTGVCIDGKCRLVNIELYWNITGRYMGFKLPEGEFLSKTEHVQFNSNEYNRLHQLLADPFSTLANYSIKELIPEKDSTKTEVDAISTATIAAVLDYIVTGAVYTTYTLWHVVYGQTKHEIEKITSERLTSGIILELLNSKNQNDQIWTLNHISEKVEISNDLQKKLLEFISSNDIYLVERALNAMKPNSLTSEFQIDMVNILDSSGFLQKRLIIQKLKDVPELDKYVMKKLSGELNNLNGALVKMTLDMFHSHKIEDETVAENVAVLLSNENRYIANQAFKYLDSKDLLNKKTFKSVEKYKKNNF